MLTNILQYFENTAARLPDKFAFSDGEQGLTFGEMHRISRAVGTAVCERGLYREPIVILMEKSAMEIAVFLGVVYAGCHYVPMDAEMPKLRMHKILETLHPRLLICAAKTEKLAREREKNLKRSGLLLAEPAVLQAMEHDSLTEPHYLPLRVSRDGNLSGSIASAAQLGKLGQYVDKLLHQIANEVRQGNIDADPCCHSEDDSFCQYCDWADACHFQDGRGGDHLRYILPVKQEKFWKSLEEGAGNDGKADLN